MAGSTTHGVYVSDDGNSYSVRLPLWEYNLNSGAAHPTVETSLPRGYIRRKRMVRYNDNLRENGVTCLSNANTLYTSAIGQAIAAPESPDFGTVPGSPNATLQGAIGERRLNRA